MAINGEWDVTIQHAYFTLGLNMYFPEQWKKNAVIKLFVDS
jgi:hypothetical protein